MTEQYQLVLPVFHAFTGCDTVSSFGGRENKTAWKICEVYPDVTEAFKHLLLMEDDISDSVMSLWERFVVLLYNQTNDHVSDNDARKQMFTQKSHNLEKLRQHRLHLYNISNEKAIKQIAETEPCVWILVFQAQ